MCSILRTLDHLQGEGDEPMGESNSAAVSEDLTDVRLDCIRSSMEGLRDEIKTHLDADSKLRAFALAALAAAILINKDAKIYLPFVPIIVVAFVGLRANITLETWTAGWSLALYEQKINAITRSGDLLHHELLYWQNRHKRYRLRSRRLAIFAAMLLGLGTYVVVLYVLWDRSTLRSTPGALLVVVVGAGIMYAFAIQRITLLLRFVVDPKRDEAIRAVAGMTFQLPREIEGEPGKWFSVLIGRWP